MKGLQIFLHSVRQVFGNLSEALRISGLLTLAQLALVFLLGLQALYAPDGGQAMMMEGQFPLAGFGIFMILSTILSLWIAVAWHRYVLREESSGSVLPMWRGDRVWAYFKIGLLTGLLAMAVALVASLIFGLIVGGMVAGAGDDISRGRGFMIALLGALLVGGPVIYVIYRLSPALPAAALGETLGLRDAWRRMAGAGSTILSLVIISVIASIVVLQGPAYLLGLQGLPALIWGVLTQWINVMVGISIMTTIYGHYIEGRPLH